MSDEEEDGEEEVVEDYPLPTPARGRPKGATAKATKTKADKKVSSFNISGYFFNLNFSILMA